MARKSLVRTFWTLISIILVLVLCLPFQGDVFGQKPPDDGPEVDAALLAEADRSDSLDYLIVFDEKADLSPAFDMDWEARGQFVYDTLTQLAATSQKEVQSYLNKEGVVYQSFWIENAIAVEGSSRATFEGLFSYQGIEALHVIPQISLVDPVSIKDETAPAGTRSVESNLTHINVDDAWALGFTGVGLVVGSIDTGVRYTHETLVGQYRGNEGGGVFDHNYDWWDAVNGQTAAYDDHNHGSHTVGIMVGDDLNGDQIGVAPGAEWIACKALNNVGSGMGTDLLECGQFMLAPTDLNGENAEPDLRPNVVNNSWGDCGRSYNNWFEDTIDAWEAAGIYPVFANGNASNCGYDQPPGLNTVGNPARGYNVTGVGSTGHSDGVYAVHSNWGPTDSLDTLNPNGYRNIKPQVVAPGVSIRSAVSLGDTSYGYYSGTSMSAPHVAGLIVLVWQAGSCLVGDYVHTETLLEETAVPIPYDTGNGDEGPGFVPNHATGWGEIDAEQAVIAAQNYCGDSTLSGTVTDSVTHQPIQDVILDVQAQIDPTNDRYAKSNPDGSYTLPVNSGETFDITASKYGYYEQSISNVDVINPGDVVTVDFSLAPKSMVTVSGTATDGSGHDYPLYARLLFDTGNFQEEVFSDPFTGAYQVGLYQDTSYDITVTAVLDGYQPFNDMAVSFNTSTATRNYAITIGEYCEAPGYTILNGLYQSFNDEVQPSNWSVTDDAGNGVVWRFDDPGGRSNYTGGSGGFAVADSDFGRLKLVNTSLISPSMNLSEQTTVILSFDQDFYVYPDSLAEVADVDVSVGGGAWQNVLNQVETVRGPNHQEIDISAIAAHQPDVRVRFHYYNANFDWWWEVDNVQVGPYDCEFVPGGSLAGFITDQDTGAAINGAEISGQNDRSLSDDTSDDPSLDAGYFWLFQPLSSGGRGCRNHRKRGCTQTNDHTG